MATLVFLLGHGGASQGAKKAAVLAGVGEWRVKNETGQTDFYFKTNTIYVTNTVYIPINK